MRGKVAELVRGSHVASWRNIRAIRVVAQYLSRGPRMQTRQYASSRSSRLTADWRATNSSADSELVSSLTQLRGRCRQLIRDASFAKRAKTIVVNNVIGSGIGMQAQVETTRGQLNKRTNEEIEYAWCEWSRAINCHTGGRLEFKFFERAAMGQVFEAGEVFIRKHPRSFGNSKIPFALELIEAERIADEIASPLVRPVPGNHIRMGIEVDQFYKPVAYYIRRRHPSEVRWTGTSIDEVERVPAEEIIHLALIDRWPQTRGEPWLHAAARRLNDMEGYSEAEVVKARAQASISGWIKTPNDAGAFAVEQEDGTFEEETEPGVWKRLLPGEDAVNPPTTSPNSVYEPFVRALLREVAAGIGVSFESLSKDYSQSNYSSSRLALIDDRDMWRVFQSWFITEFRQAIHREWMYVAVLSGQLKTIDAIAYALDRDKYEAVRYKPRGWTWVDPTKEVQAYIDAIKAGMTTLSDVIAATGGGRDAEDIFDERKRELELAKENGLVFETSPEFYLAANKTAGNADTSKPPDPEDKQPATADEQPNPAPRRVFSFGSKR
jgi:lambda family phage portal protein